MEPSPSAQPKPPVISRRLGWLLLVITVAGYAWFLRVYTSPYAGGSDSSGYLNSATLLLQGRVSSVKPALAGHGPSDFSVGAHQPLGFITRARTDEMAPSYPLGLPLHLAVFSLLVGLDWATIPLNICTALAGGGLLYLLARRLDLPPATALAGVAVMALCPLYLFAATQPMSDLLALSWCLAAIYTALRAREKPAWALACGLAIAWAVLVRPSNLLVAIPVVLILGTAWRSYLWVGLGGLPGAILLAVYNHQIYGSAFATGYGDIWGAFSRHYAAHNLAFFARWIPGLLSPLVLAVLAAPFLQAGRRRELGVHAAWAVALIGFYTFYYHSGETWWYLRFILPAFPALILIALVVLHSFSAAAGRSILGAALLAAALTWEVRQTSHLYVLQNKAAEATYPDSAAWARAHLPANAAILCMQVSGAFYYYTDFLLLRWEQIPPSSVESLSRVLHEQRRPVYAVIYDFEEADARQRMGGHWRKITRIRNATIWQVDLGATSP